MPIVIEGSASSGNFGHAGRPGEVGGSGPGGATSDAGTIKLGQTFRADGRILTQRNDEYPGLIIPLANTRNTEHLKEIIKKDLNVCPAKDVEGLEGVQINNVADWESMNYQPGTGSRARLVLGMYHDKYRSISVPDHMREAHHTIVHEVGHHVWHEKLPTEIKKGFIDLFWAAKGLKEREGGQGFVNIAPLKIKWPSEYAKKNIKEFFAETYRDYRLGRKVDRRTEQLLDSFYKTKQEQVTEGSASSGNYGHAGRPGEVGGSAPGSGSTDAGGAAGDKIGARESKSDLTRASSRKDLPKHITALVIPPAWTDIRYNENPKGDLMVVGTDAAGRDQSVYSAKFAATKMAEKFARIEALDEVAPQIEKELLAAVKNGDEAAALAYFVMKTGLRPGTEHDTGAKVQAYGATTLMGKHVKVSGDMVHMTFVGKSGVTIDLSVEDPIVAKVIADRKEQSGPNGKLFKISDRALGKYIGTLDGGGFTTKDFRTLYGTVAAQTEVAKIKTLPKSQKEYTAMCKAVAKIVAKKLGNTPTVALQSYINPSTFARWRKNKWAS